MKSEGLFIYPGMLIEFCELLSGCSLTDYGWRLWLACPPPHGVLIQITREGADWELVTTRDDIPPEANASGFYWRLTGIGRMQVAA